MASCSSHVRAGALRARLCGRCYLLPTDDRGAWVEQLGKATPFPGDVVRSALKDSDWQVRWGAVRARALAQGARPQVTLANWVATSRSRERPQALVTASRVALAQGVRPADFLAGAGRQGEKAAELVAHAYAAVRQELESELYDASPRVAGEALAQVARLTDVEASRALLAAVLRHPSAMDARAAALLRRVAAVQKTPVGRVLERIPEADLAPAVKRLTGLYAGELEPIRLAVRDEDWTKRKAAVEVLALYEPLAHDALARALVQDANPSVRLAVARALAQGEGRTLGEAAMAAWAAKTSSGEERRVWMRALATAAEPGCSAWLAQAGGLQTLPLAERAVAYELVGACPDGDRIARLRPALDSPETTVRIAAVDALRGAHALPDATEALRARLDDKDASVVVAAIGCAAAWSERGFADAIATKLLSASPTVREAAARALIALGDASHVKMLMGRMKLDDAAQVRLASAQALGTLATPRAARALTATAERDADARVRGAAADALRQLGARVHGR